MENKFAPSAAREVVKPEVPKLIIFVATDFECQDIVRPALERLQLFGRKDIWVVRTGAGKVNATLTACLVLCPLLASNPDIAESLLCVNVGVCTGNDVAMKDAPVAQIHRVREYDFNIEALGTKTVPEFSIAAPVEDVNICLSQDCFCTDPATLPNDGKPYYCDMELFGIASACSKLNVRLSALKSVCSVVGDEKQVEQFNGGDGYKLACQRATDVLVDYLLSGVDITL